MYLRNIFLQINRDETWKQYDEYLIPRFGFNCYFVWHYLSKMIRRYHCGLDIDCKSISIQLTFGADCINPDKTAFKCLNCLNASIHIFKEEFDSYLHEPLSSKRYEYLLQWLERGYHYINQYYRLPLDILIDLHNMFRENEFRNESLFKAVTCKSSNNTVFLTKVLTEYDFHLKLEIVDRATKQLLLSGSVFRTLPDELCYKHLCRSVSVEGQKLIIYDFLEKPAFSIDYLNSIRGKDIHIESLNPIFDQEKEIALIDFWNPQYLESKFTYTGFNLEGKAQAHIPGAIFQFYIDGYYSYGQMLSNNYIVLLDCFVEEPLTTFEILEEASVYFYGHVFSYVTEDGSWPIVTILALRKGFHPLPSLWIHDDSKKGVHGEWMMFNPNTGEKTVSEKNDCVGLFPEDRYHDKYNRIQLCDIVRCHINNKHSVWLWDQYKYFICT